MTRKCKYRIRFNGCVGNTSQYLILSLSKHRRFNTTANKYSAYQCTKETARAIINELNKDFFTEVYLERV